MIGTSIGATVTGTGAAPGSTGAGIPDGVTGGVVTGGVVTGKVLPVLQDKKNHVIDALRYACEGVRRMAAIKPATFKPLPTAHKW